MRTYCSFLESLLVIFGIKVLRIHSRVENSVRFSLVASFDFEIAAEEREGRVQRLLERYRNLKIAGKGYVYSVLRTVQYSIQMPSYCTSYCAGKNGFSYLQCALCCRHT